LPAILVFESPFHKHDSSDLSVTTHAVLYGKNTGILNYKAKHMADFICN